MGLGGRSLREDSLLLRTCSSECWTEVLPFALSTMTFGMSPPFWGHFQGGWLGGCCCLSSATALGFGRGLVRPPGPHFTPGSLAGPGGSCCICSGRRASSRLCSQQALPSARGPLPAWRGTGGFTFSTLLQEPAELGSLPLSWSFCPEAINLQAYDLWLCAPNKLNLSR